MKSKNDNGNKELKKPQTTLRDVAVAANVSEMTVSRVMRNRGPVAEKTRKKILGIVDQLGFVPNKIAGSLATSSSNLIAVIVPSLRNQVFTEVLAGITEHLELKGFKPVIGISEYDSDQEEALIRSMLSWRPSGLIVSSMAHTEPTRKILKKAGIPIVEIMRVAKEPVDACVGIDHINAGVLMAQHFMQKGYQQIGYVGWSNRDLTAAKRFQGFSEELKKNDLEIIGVVEFDQPVDMERGKEGLATLLADYPNLDAVYFPNDIAAIGGYFHCLGAGIDVPSELAIGGFSGLKIGQLMPVSLTTVLIDRFEIGRRSAEIIVERLDGQQPESINIVDISLVKGGTT
ncbi:MAG: LacI family DNA-binding transcriptional regulator [Gammaproteobacteria bacterium]|nr:LacI family DNA-binding transcriptional regulator [Gammaproteobacteria bacterium]